MRRREFIGLIGGAALSFVKARVPLAQEAVIPLIGFLNSQRAAGFTHLLAALHRGLAETGHVVGQNVAIEYRWADGNPDRLWALADDLVRLPVAVLVTTGGSLRVAVSVAKTTPIVSTFGGDPVRLGYVRSMNRPGGNITGASTLTANLEAKRLEMLHELVPGPAILGVLLDRDFPEFENQLREVQAAAKTLGRDIRTANASSDIAIEEAFSAFAHWRVGGVVIVGGPFFTNRRERLVAASARYAIAAVFEQREMVMAGGLMSYGSSLPEVHRQLGVYAGRILKGERPADLPVVQPTKFDIAINLKTAKALGIEVPTPILLRADEVIE